MHRAQVKIAAIHLRSSVQQCLLRENGDTKSFGGKKESLWTDIDPIVFIKLLRTTRGMYVAQSHHINNRILSKEMPNINR